MSPLIPICTLLASSSGVQLGAFHTDSPNGIAFIKSPKAAFVLRVAGYEGDKLVANYGDLVEPARKLGYTVASPNGAFYSLEWNVGEARVRLRWLKTGVDSVIGEATTDKPVKLMLQALPFWEKSTSDWSWDAGSLNGASKADGTKLRVVLSASPIKAWVSSTYDDLVKQQAEGSGFGGALYDLSPAQPLTFAAGLGTVAAPAGVTAKLDKAQADYVAQRPRATGDWGDFLEAITNNMNHSQVWNPDTGLLAHVVSRGWCRPDGQVLFCWDSFFNGLLSSVEEPTAGRDTIRAVLAAQLDNGLVANFSGRSWGVSSDRSQPPVGSMCVWKMHQRWPSKEFLTEVYPKLVKWHDWWFAKRPGTNKGNRDGNRNGLLEWGSETGATQDARFESGLDDSPMFDGAKMDGPNMTMDSVDLSSLWAMDGEYLSRIARAIGKTDDAKRFKKESADMTERIAKLLWNEELGIYCNRYWEPIVLAKNLPIRECVVAGFDAEYFLGRSFEKSALSAKENAPWLAQNSLPAGIPANDFSVRWVGEFVAPTDGDYIFEASADDGVRVYLNDKLIIDDWSVHAAQKVESKPIKLNYGAKAKLKVEYFQAEGGASLEFKINVVDANAKPNAFSERLAPCNFYPLMTVDPPAAQLDRTLKFLTDTTKFWGEFVCPTVARDDPSFPQQHYWRGKIWAPTNYLMFLGLKRHAPDKVRADFAAKSVKLFMDTWKKDGTCHENFLSNGEGSSDPHYTWGALLCLLALEDVVDIEPDGQVRLNGTLDLNLTLSNLPIGGKLYDVKVTKGHAVISKNGNTVLEATGKVVKKKLG